MSKEQQAKDMAELATRLASNGDMESLSLMAKVCGHIEVSDDPVKAAKASRIAFLGAASVAAIGVVSGNFSKLADGMRDVLHEYEIKNADKRRTEIESTSRVFWR